MRRFLCAFALAASVSAIAAAAEPPNARAAYVERRGLVEIDAQCTLFAPNLRAALEASASQARGSLLRSGWSRADVLELERLVVSAARARACTDRRTIQSAADARTAFASWANANVMQFPGWDRTWTARRVVGQVGWRLSQSIEAPLGATFGVREHTGSQELALAMPLPHGREAPTSARLILRSPTSGVAPEVSLSARMSYGLEAGLPAPSAAVSIPSRRMLERLEHGARQASFIFPDSAFRDLLALDPRETVEIRVSTGRSEQRLLVEIGDLGAARAFVTIR